MEKHKVVYGQFTHLEQYLLPEKMTIGPNTLMREKYNINMIYTLIDLRLSLARPLSYLISNALSGLVILITKPNLKAEMTVHAYVN